MPQIDPTRRTALYRLHNESGVLLYVGIAFDPDARWEQHRKTKSWWPLVASKVVEWHETRTAAERAERVAIHAEHPKFNESHAPLATAVKVGRNEVDVIPLTEARPRLTDAVDRARDCDIATAWTERRRPRAFVVSVPFFERAERDAAVVERLRGQFPDLFETLAEGLPASVVPQKMAKN